MIRPPRLSAAEHERQAAAFLDLLDRSPLAWEDLLARWAGEDGKDFLPADAECVRALVRAELIARGDIMPTWEDYDAQTEAA